MYCNYTKCHAFPLISRVSKQPNCLLLYQDFAALSVSYGSRKNPGGTTFHVASNHRNFSNRLHLKILKNINTTVRTRKYSDGCYRESSGTGEVRECKPLPWIAAYNKRDRNGTEKERPTKTSRSSWEESARGYFSRNNGEGSKEYKNVRIRVDEAENIGGRYGHNKRDASEEEDEDEDTGPVNDPRWDRIKDRYRRFNDRETDRPEVRRWTKQEDWARKTWKEATVSSVPKMVGEGVYGVGPVLAALTAGRREYYALFVQEGLDFSGNNRRKKDKRGIEKALKIAEKIGLTIKESSKHDLNMIVDNRPHQGLILDASPLQMVGIRELDPVSDKEENAQLWVALDEVTDPQNLGAIVRSAYYFGAAGIVLCAKNSAPLSGVVSKASAGALELVELRSCKNMMQFLTSSGENGWRVLGGSVSPRAVPLNDVKTGVPTILVLGSEGSGLRPLVEKSCTQLIRIPGNLPAEAPAFQSEDQVQTGTEYLSFLAVESLNVSVATERGRILFE
ncbi:hypothetical protein H6P81_009048 [Aristolochia fimbriata]|uniref:rRNA methyltransferase 1, mitochondrial n=1 Tax=Aristolochia fimbriata TaxID=158543 RepID=A0AAV7EJY4_ARIFI|nr:hypothetical protein H6P81_009048 [Aristolochia fimbriata]